MNYNSLHEAGCWFGIIVELSVLAGLVAIGAWGALAFIAVSVPLVGWAERWRDAERRSA